MQQLRLVVFVAACQAAWALGSAQGVKSPVEKVVVLLKDLQTKIEADGKSEQQSYDKYACWCEKTTTRKADSIVMAQKDVRSLGQDMLKLKGTVATLLSEISELTERIKANEKAQETMTTLRQKSHGKFTAATTEMKEVLVALEKAIVVLREGAKPSFLQQDSAARSAIQTVVEALPATAELKPKQQVLLNQLTAQGGSKAGYAPQSSTVQGLLRDMYDTFSADLETATLTEATENRDFEQFIAIKTKELNDLEATKVKKMGEKADAESLLADRTASYDDATEQMKADVIFFDEVKDACKKKHDKWDTRASLRADELSGIKEALEILTSDESRELFASTIKAGKETHMDDSYDTGVKIASLLQVSGGHVAEEPVQRAYSSLKEAAAQAHSFRLAALAVRVQEAKVGHFEKVLSAIEDMMLKLKEEGQEDIQKRDQCIEEYKGTDSKMADITWKIEKNDAKINKLTYLITRREGERETTIQEITDVDSQLKAMKEERVEENSIFNQSKIDDQSAISLLMQAREALSEYYQNNKIAMGPVQGSVKGLELNQQGPEFDVSANEAPEATFADKGVHRHESKGIVQLMTMIIEDLNDEIKNSMRAEEMAQLDYEKQVKAATELREKLLKRKTNLEAIIAKRGEEKGDEETDKEENEGDLKSETDYRKEITPDCDWMMGAFTERAAKRTAEIDGLAAAKEYIAGYKPSSTALLDEQHVSSKRSLSDIRFSGLAA